MLRFAANLTMLFNELDFLDRFAAAKRAGFEGVEYLFPYPYDKNVLAEKLAANGLKQVLHNLPAGNWAAGERGIACLPRREAEFRDGVGIAIEYAKALGCTQLNCLAGIPSATTGIGWAEETLVENLKFAARALRAEGIRLLLEPINTRDIPGFLVCHTQRAFDYFDQVGEDNLYLLYDAYHMQVMEGDLTSTIERNLKRIAHIQIADNPGRHEPGTGEINYPFVFGRLQAMDYSGWIGCEYKPTAGTVAGLGWVTPYLTRSPVR
jgi:hydroxypyruvate isomerase